MKNYYPYNFNSYLADGYQMNLQGAWNNLFVKVHLDHVFSISSVIYFLIVLFCKKALKKYF